MTARPLSRDELCRLLAIVRAAQGDFGRYPDAPLAVEAIDVEGARVPELRREICERLISAHHARSGAEWKGFLARCGLKKKTAEKWMQRFRKERSCDQSSDTPRSEQSRTSSHSDGRSSERSSERETSSSDRCVTTSSGASSTASVFPAKVRLPLAGAASVCASRSDAEPTAAFAAPRTPSSSTERLTEVSMLDVPRPTTRSDCRAEARPCPWVGCRHHLLLEVASAKVEDRKDPRATTMRLNAADPVHVRTGRRPGLSSSAAALLVRTWIDDAVELLPRLRYTCALDVADDYPDGLAAHSIGMLLGVGEGIALINERAALLHVRQHLAAYAPDGIRDVAPLGGDAQPIESMELSHPRTPKVLGGQTESRALRPQAGRGSRNGGEPKDRGAKR